MRLLDATGMSAPDVDSCMTLGAGHPMGPLKLLDFVGLDVSIAIGESLHADSGRESDEVPPKLRALVAEGALGRKSGPRLLRLLRPGVDREGESRRACLRALGQATRPHPLRATGACEATQLLRQGFMREVPNAAAGDLPRGLDDVWVAHMAYTPTAAPISRARASRCIAHLPPSLGFARRVLCHSRLLSERTRSNPDADTEVVELRDRLERVESEAFLAEYRLAADHDQDQLRVWQLFSPRLIQWLTDDAPEGFSFELQDGALCCVVRGSSEGGVRVRAVRLGRGLEAGHRGLLSGVARRRTGSSGSTRPSTATGTTTRRCRGRSRRWLSRRSR